MSIWVVAEAAIVLIAVGCWRQAKNPKLAKPERMAGYTYSVYFILLAATIFLSGIALVLAAKASSITAACILAIGLSCMKHSSDPHIDPELAAFEKVFASDFIVLAISRCLTSAVVSVLCFLSRT